MLLTNPWRAYFIFGAFNFTMAILAFWVPETKGVRLPILCYRDDNDANLALQISLERMDELFGVADFSHVEDVGLAAKHAKSVDDDADDVEHVHMSKV